MQAMLVTLGGLDLELGFTFGAGREIAGKVADPLMIAREAGLEAMLGQAGIVHSPKWMPTIENVPMIIWIGTKHGGMDLKLEAVQEAVFRHGFAESKAVALDYLAGIVTPSAREQLDTKGDGEAGE